MDAQELQPIYVDKFTGGINKSTTADNIADNELDECLNMNLAEDGHLDSRLGGDQFNSTLTGGDRVTSICYARKSDGTSDDIIVTTLAKIYKDNGSGGWTDITGGTAPPSDTLWMWRTFNNKAIGVNGVSVPQAYDFSSVANLGGSPPDKCKILEVWMGRVYLAGDTDEPTALHACAADDSADWSTAGDAFTIYVDKDNGHEITGLANFFGSLIIFKRKGVYRLLNPSNDPAEMVLTQLFSNVGCISPYSIRQIGNELVWLSADGVYALRATQESGDVAHVSISRKIQSYINDTTYSLLNEAYAMDQRALSQYRLTVPKSGSSENDHTLVRDYFHGAWLRQEGINFACFGEVILSGAITYLAGGYDGKVYKIDLADTYNDDGAAIEYSVKTKRFHHGVPPFRKKFNDAYTEFATDGDYAIGFVADIDGTTSKGFSLIDDAERATYDTSLWGVPFASTDIKDKWVCLGKKGKNCQFQYSHAVADEPFSLYKIALLSTLLGGRG